MVKQKVESAYAEREGIALFSLSSTSMFIESRYAPV